MNCLVSLVDLEILDCLLLLLVPLLLPLSLLLLRRRSLDLILRAQLLLSRPVVL